MSTPPSSAFRHASPAVADPPVHADCVYRTVTLAAMLLLLVSLWAF
ncbi:MAG: hypothetical protein ACLGPM_00145 [Acidobacteriota bacterium]